MLTGAISQPVDPSQLAGLNWRNIGPFRGGRISAVAGVYDEPNTYYVGLPQGGVWKTTNGGVTWNPIFDAVKETATVGSVEVAPSNHNVVYAGTGEVSIMNPGYGLYKSVDAGHTWQRIGLEDARLIPSLLVDPKDPDLVLAGAVGDPGKESPDRGVYRSTDGGHTWKKTLFVGNTVGVTHLSWAFDNPSVVFAETIRAGSRFGGFTPGAKPPEPETMVYKSADEGQTWTKLDGKGLPKLTGRICVAVAQGTNSQRLYLIGTFGLYRSDDGGANWRQMAADDGRIANGQGNYSCDVCVSPTDPDTVYTIATCVFRSTDGGKTFVGFKGSPGGDDPHFLWIDPHNGNRMLLGGDQGATVSVDAGASWTPWYNQITAQIYHVAVDNQYPYWVYGTQQDSGCVEVCSRGNLGQITPWEWRTHPGMEFGYVVPDPLDANITYSLSFTLKVMKSTMPSGQYVEIDPSRNPKLGLRGGFAQIGFSASNPHELLVGYQRLMSSTDRGAHWRAISPDLTLKPGEVPPKPGAAQGGVFVFGNSINSFSTSPISNGVIWATTSNGRVQVTKDHGDHWSDVTFAPAGIKQAGYGAIEAGGTNSAEAYVTVTNPGADVPKPVIYRTKDFGVTWTDISNGLPTDRPNGANAVVVRADPKKAGLLFAVIDCGVYVSFDDGGAWQSLTLNMPATSYSDLQIHGDDLVLSTFGRGFWILDNYTPLQQISASTFAEPAHLFRPGDAIRVRRNVNQDTPLPIEVPHAANPPLGAVIYYSLAAKPNDPVTIEILDSRGEVVRHMSSVAVESYDDPAPPVEPKWLQVRKPLPTEVGLNRVNWDIRYDTPSAFVHDAEDVMGAVPGDTPAAIEGPLALPGNYTVRLTVDGKSYTQPLVVRNDPRSPASYSDIAGQFEVQKGMYEGAQMAFQGYQEASKIRATLDDILKSNPDGEVAKAVKDFDAKVATLQGKIVRGRQLVFGPPNPGSFTGLNTYLLAHLETTNYGDLAPDDGLMGFWGNDWSKIHALCGQWKALNGKDLSDLNAVLAKKGMKQIQSARDLEEPLAPPKRYLP